MIVFVAMGVVFVIGFAYWRIRRRRSRILTPLAGLDTGVRSPFRAPRGLFNNRRGF